MCALYHFNVKTLTKECFQEFDYTVVFYKLFLLNTMCIKSTNVFLILSIIKYSYRTFVFRNRKNGKAAEEEHSSSLNE